MKRPPRMCAGAGRDRRRRIHALCCYSSVAYMDGSGQLNKARRGYQRHESGEGGNKSSHCLQLAIIYAENSNYLQIITSNKRLQYGGLAQEQCHLHFSM